jgi:ribosome biogenesis GTPase / thiamine phosphate phosphatase
MKATVYKSTGSWYVVKTADQKFWDARLRGSFKIDGLTSTNPLVVGDSVEIEPESSGTAAIISEIHTRKNYINRQSPAHKMQQHIVAANIDQSLLIASLKAPKTSQGFIDRFLVTGEAYHIPSVIVLNKADIYGKKEIEKFRLWEEMYKSCGYEIVLVSMLEEKGIGELKMLLRDKVSLLSGPSGVGKSTFINSIFPSMHSKTRDVSGWSGKGMHTTTFAEMFDLPEGGQVIDTPGLREFGLFDISKEVLSHYFPEMRIRLQGCQFNDCLHINEPGCAIKKALQEGEIYADRYNSYCKILESIEDNNY